jgi:predicted peroxiredoxin
MEATHMTTAQKDSRDLVVLMTRGIDHELSSVGFTIACGGITAGLRVSIFLTSAAIDLVRKNGVELTQVQPLDPLRTLMRDFVERGGKIWACPPCVKARGYTQADLMPGVEIVGASAMHALILQGAATLSF